MAEESSGWKESRTEEDLAKDGSSKRLAESIDDASLLVWYASKHGITGIEKSTIEILSGAKEKEKTGWTASDEATFWDNYRILASIISPVSVESIRSSFGAASNSKTSAGKAIRIYSRVTLGVMIVLIALQAYWFIGTSMTKEVEDIKVSIREAKDNMESLTQEINWKFQEVSTIEKQLGEKQKIIDYNEEIEQDILTLETSLDLAKRHAEEMRMQIAHEKNKVALFNNKLSGNYIMLNVWDPYSELFIYLAEANAACDEGEGGLESCDKDVLRGRFDPAAVLIAEAARDAAAAAIEGIHRAAFRTAKGEAVFQAADGRVYDVRGKDRTSELVDLNTGPTNGPATEVGLGGTEERKAETDLEDAKKGLESVRNSSMPTWEQYQKAKARLDETMQAYQNAETRASVRYEMWLLTAKSVLAILNQYLLPLLYGLLGSLAYILRTLTREIREVTYTRSSNVGYRLRWPLGMLAGVTIGWFFDPDTLQGVASITPLGLAFLAGYSVELLFAGLDRIVGAFTEPSGQAKA